MSGCVWRTVKKQLWYIIQCITIGIANLTFKEVGPNNFLPISLSRQIVLALISLQKYTKNLAHQHISWIHVSNTVSNVSDFLTEEPRHFSILQQCYSLSIVPGLCCCFLIFFNLIPCWSSLKVSVNVNSCKHVMTKFIHLSLTLISLV